MLAIDIYDFFSHGVTKNPLAQWNSALRWPAPAYWLGAACNDECSEDDPRLVNSIQFRNKTVKD